VRITKDDFAKLADQYLMVRDLALIGRRIESHLQALGHFHVGCVTN